MSHHLPRAAGALASIFHAKAKLPIPPVTMVLEHSVSGGTGSSMAPVKDREGGVGDLHLLRS